MPYLGRNRPWFSLHHPEEGWCWISTTERETMPTVQVLECADAGHGLGGHVMSDGGCTNPGDVAKAFGAGADFVMIGGLFAGHDQSGGEVIEQNGKKFKLFYGMSSDTAMNKHHGSVAEYRASEGKTITIPYRGDVNSTVLDILGGIRSACTYTGSAKLKELPKRTTFIRVTQQTNDMYVPFEVNPQM
ncbi:IMP dehydrogenase / GMP reductase domain protein [Ancylostoma duodenale]|uniref:GMP reductase n=1 Tax=Ancylostoma duodenale TaxID=51022 RepID=A0A0C2CJL8_9BILA|nr:IMP dehydrogenase / GMP reductase domain protein [Ancylostoma duodenale]